MEDCVCYMVKPNDDLRVTEIKVIICMNLEAMKSPRNLLHLVYRICGNLTNEVNLEAR